MAQHPIHPSLLYDALTRRKDGTNGWRIARTLLLKYVLGVLSVWGIVSIIGASVGFWGLLGITALLFVVAALADV